MMQILHRCIVMLTGLGHENQSSGALPDWSHEHSGGSAVSGRRAAGYHRQPRLDGQAVGPGGRQDQGHTDQSQEECASTGAPSYTVHMAFALL